MLKITAIESSTDIDNLSPGIYNGIGWQIDGTSQAGFLIALSPQGGSYYRFQIALLYASNANIIKHRCYNGSWSSWKEV